VVFTKRVELTVGYMTVLGIECITDVIRLSILREFGHVERRIVMIGFQH